MKLPPHVCMHMTHNPHRGIYQTVEHWLDYDMNTADLLPEDRAQILATGEIWEMSWCPRTPVGSCRVVAATLARLLELANQDEETPRPEQAPGRG